MVAERESTWATSSAAWGPAEVEVGEEKGSVPRKMQKSTRQSHFGGENVVPPTENVVPPTSV